MRHSLVSNKQCHVSSPYHLSTSTFNSLFYVFKIWSMIVDMITIRGRSKEVDLGNFCRGKSKSKCRHYKVKCQYCKKEGNWKAKCLKLKKKNDTNSIWMMLDYWFWVLSPHLILKGVNKGALIVIKGKLINGPFLHTSRKYHCWSRIYIIFP
ncbi:hypothetical protein CR513_43332, partial [Mucuna pruriens]